MYIKTSLFSLYILLLMIIKVDSLNITIIAPGIAGGDPTFNGNATHLAEFPYMAALGWNNEDTGIVDFLCGGMLIGNKTVLTAAHCAYKNDKIPNIVFLGGQPLTEYSINKRLNLEYWVHNITVHPQYNPAQGYHDIAIVELQRNVSNLQGLHSICLWNHRNLTSNDTTAIGYGLTEFAGSDSKQLLKVNLTVFSTDFCEPFFKRQRHYKLGISNAHICAGDMSGEKDTCQGDSGGPLILTHKGQHFAVGVTSTGQACSGFPPGIYTKISSYRKWITNVLASKMDELPLC